MKKILIVTACAVALAGCGQVAPGHVGIRVNQFGSNAGVSNEALGVGTYFTPFGTTISSIRCSPTPTPTPAAPMRGSR